MKWLLALIIKNSWACLQYDVKNASSYANIDREKFISIPQGAIDDPKKFVCKVKRALYGFAKAPKCWNNCLNDFLLSLGFIRNERDPCLYKLEKDSNHKFMIAVKITLNRKMMD